MGKIDGGDGRDVHDQPWNRNGGFRRVWGRALVARITSLQLKTPEQKTAAVATQAEPDATGDSDRSSHYVNESERTLLGGYNPEDLRLGKRKVLGR